MLGYSKVNLKIVLRSLIISVKVNVSIGLSALLKAIKDVFIY
jgi:hypothetical protein